ncbi:hypothetical protein MMC34_000687 [Xylographa carneopallida]|nr:hypothetical protein [Xylographa carneopallida]
MASQKSILVFGATGKQGGALIKQLLDSQPDPPFKILALTRNTTSAKARDLASKPNVSLVEGDLNDCEAIFKKTGPVWGVFSVQVPFGERGASVETEEKQGKALVDAAVANGVHHFVYTSVDRGGAKSDEDPTDVPHFISKYRIEKYLIEKAASSHMGWIILRPTTFFENLTPGFMGKLMVTMFQSLGDKKLQWISCKDIGYFAAEAFKDPEKYNQKSIALAGEDMSMADAKQIFEKEIGYPLPSTFSFVGTAVKYLVGDLGKMVTWFEKAGYAADIDDLRKQHPGLLNFRQWLQEESAFETH